MEAVCSILLVFSSFLLNGAYPQLLREKRNLIIGGAQISMKEAPYQAAVFVNRAFVCGGSIIGSRWILTAGHCLLGDMSKDGMVVVGTGHRNKGGVEKKITQSFVHPNYVKDQTVVISTDIALLQLDGPLNFDGNSVSCVSIPAPGQKLPTGTVGKVSGWGRTNKLLNSVDILRAVYTTVLPIKQCQDAYAHFGISIDDRTQYCVGDSGDTKGSCKGDSGGPFVVGNTVYGIVSWSRSCTEIQYPGIYTDVGAYVQWIRDTVASSASPEELQCNA